MPAKSSGKLLSATQLLLGCLLAFGVYEFATARNQGRIPGSLDNLVGIVWLCGVIALIAWQARNAEDRCVGNLHGGKVTLAAGEETLFKNNFMSGKFFPAGMAFNPEPSLTEWLRGGPITVTRLLQVRVTNQRLIFGLFLLGRTWRAIDLSMINDLVLVNGKWPYRNALLIEYDRDRRAEKIMVWVGSSKGQRLKTSLGIALNRDV